MDVRITAELAQTVAIVGGAVWALFLYRKRRRGQVRVGLQHNERLLRHWSDNRSVLLVRLRIANTSGVLYRHREATATLMDARKESNSGTLRLVPFKQADPFPPVYGTISDDADSIESGETFVLEDSDLMLEPGEYVETEIAFVLDDAKLGLMAVQVLIMGSQGRWGRKGHWWGTFFYVDPRTVPGH